MAIMGPKMMALGDMVPMIDALIHFSLMPGFLFIFLFRNKGQRQEFQGSRVFIVDFRWSIFDGRFFLILFLDFLILILIFCFWNLFGAWDLEFGISLKFCRKMSKTHADSLFISYL
jgi:hypothetical protein